MMKIKTLLYSLLFSSSAIFAQTNYLQKCGTTDYIEYRDAVQPGYVQSVNQVFQEAKSSQQGAVLKSDETYRIPVVVHILYNTEDQNLSDAVIHDQIRTLNEDYNRRNADTVNLRSEFLPYAGSANISFELANFTPEGAPTNGITRTETEHATFSGDALELISGNMSSIERVKQTDQGGQDPWDQSRYLNIWVCNMAIVIPQFNINTPVILGYATPPSDLPNWPPGSTSGMNDGVVVQYQVFGSNNPNALNPDSEESYIVKGRTLTHEVGHYLGLRHIWGDGGCDEHDGIDDTPNADSQSDSDCDATKNTCVDNIDGIDLPDMIENYMDYSAETCQNTFTAGQVSLMQGVLENQRWELVNDNPALSIKESELASLKIFPNPANTVVTIQSNQNSTQPITITDINGKTVRTHLMNGKETTLNIEDLQQGIYFVHLTGKAKTLKLIKL